MKKLLASLIFISSFSFGQSFYDLNTIQTIEITFAQSNWDALLDAAEPSDAYISAQSVAINGTVFPNVGAKYKGNSSYDANQVKNPWHLELDQYVDQNYQGYTDIKLSNVIFDPSFVREALAYKVLGNYMDVPLANYAKLYVNGVYIGLYTNVESISKKFVDNRFGSKTNAFFDCSPPAGAGPTSTNLPTLQYLGTNYTSYETAYDLKSTTGWDDLINLTNTLSTTTSANTASIESVLDIDRTLWMLAFDNIFVNLDSYIGQFKQNYYLYKSNNGQFNPIVWDLNMCFGTFGNTGSTTSGGGPGGPGGGSTSLTSTQKQQLSHTLHSTESTWPLVQKLLAIPSYKKKYLAHYKTILNEVLVSGSYLTDAQNLQALIATAVSTDVNKFSYQSNIANGLTTDTSVGNNTAPGLSTLMNGRKTYLNALSDFTNIQPSIASVTPSTTSPLVGANVSITANVTNTTTSSVSLAYRSLKNDIFVKTQMFDDGAHNDGVAGDNVYGASIPVNNVAIQYYIYAENTNAGKFSPERAEHEFYTINATYPTITAGQLVVNEIMASNTLIPDQDGQFDDWFELYNNTANTLSLDNLYASDSQTNKLKWQFPTGTTIAPHSYLIVWADSDLTQAGLHADFKFSASGENCILSYANGTIVDNVIFGAQTTDMSYARNPNGTGNFVIQAATFNANNQSLATTEIANSKTTLKVYPNPTTSIVYLENNESPIESVQIFNTSSQSIFKSTYKKEKKVGVDMTNYPVGMYIIRINNKDHVKILKK
ncbi:CotH kinase family protein [Frigoriflavimonas asaccharolytica]|uniref:Spore coat protein CotH n=1 Tax=Frigoriflavimonas asaccharolytica TaxID=2735899 RepID=A0A8J8K7K3_9FLAO|nr:CotH kinase family protein [Frigoriflavimonas asaccharolytica]NRS92103.1 spore coat protein CotH [Frigoriflavimonas asaccharolytica]